MSLAHDILLEDTAFTKASADMKALKTRAETLKTKLEGMYQALTTAMNTPAGKQIETKAKDVIIKPIDDMLLVIKHISESLDEIIGTGYYKDVFIKFEELNQSIKFS